MIHALKPAFVKAASNAPVLLATSHYQNRVISYPPRNIAPMQPRREFCTLTVLAGAFIGVIGSQKRDGALVGFACGLIIFGAFTDC